MIRRITGLRAALALAFCACATSAQAPPSGSGTARPAATAAHPTLVVLITVDQLRADYLTRFGPQLHGGLGRLMRGGAWFTDAHHDHAITETAPGHATLLAGRYPRSTGIMLNRAGVEDDAAALIGGAVGTGASPRRFVGTTLVDWLRTADPRSKSLSVSMKDRAAILPVGRSRTNVYWYAPDGRFTTSRYYADSLPTWVNAFNARRLPQGYAGKAWTLLLPDTAYPENDAKLVQLGVSTFPHKLPSDTAGAVNLVRITPFIDDITAAFALQGLTALDLGAGPQTDLLAMSLSATDIIGHRYGPDSREIHDDVLRLDRTVGAFLDSLYRVRDSSRVVVVLTSDHGVAPIPELAANGSGAPPERVDLAPLVTALRAGLRAAKVDTMAIELDQQIVFVDRAAFKAASVNADSALSAFAANLRREPGVRRVDQYRTLIADSLKDAIARRWSHQFPATSPVELVITLTPYSTWGGNVASHGSPYDYDTQVPLLFYGAGVRPGRYDAFVRTVDLAPTLAALAGVKPTERLDGVVLGDAVMGWGH
jgi:predicted AlkP superfamily pyrophosphatase or phosphodiesterase